MIAIDTMLANLDRVVRMFADKRVGVFPSDYGRFDQSIGSLLTGENVVGILLDNPRNCAQGLEPFYNRDQFLASIDVCLCWGMEKDYYELFVYAAKNEFPVRFVNLLDPEEPLGLLSCHKLPEYFHVPADKLDDEGLAVLTGITAKYLRTFAEFEQDITRNVQEWVHHTPYQTGAVRDGAIPFACPYCGESVFSSHSFVISGRQVGHSVFHPFSCCKEFFLISKPYGFNYSAIYIPSEEQVVLLAGVHGSTAYPLEKKIFKAVAQLKVLLFQYRDQVLEYLASSTTGSRGVMGTTGNVGHYIISECNAVHLFQEEFGSPVDCVSINSKVHSLMQGIADGVTLQLATAQDEKRTMANLFLGSVQDKRLGFFPYTWAPLAQGARRPLLDSARERCTVRADREMQRLKSCSSRILVTLRPPTRRIWTTQDEDTAWILNKLHEKYPGLGVVFDGLLMEGGFCLRDNLEAITAGLHPDILISEAIDCPLEETLAWADLCHLNFGPAGGGLGLMLAADIPIVTFGLLESYADLVWERDGCTLTTGTDMDHAPIKFLPSSNERVEGNDFYYDVDREVILHTVQELLGQALDN